MKKIIKFNDLLKFIAEHESFSETIAEYSGMNRKEIEEILLKHGRNPDNPDVEVIIEERVHGQTGMTLRTNYVVYVDGASRGNPGPSGIGVVVYNGKDEVKKISRFIGEATNNEAEYEALIEGLKAVLNLKFYSVQFFSDSELMVNQIKGQYRVLDPKLEKLYNKAFKDIHRLTAFQITYLGRRKNRVADKLANKAIDDALAKEK